MRIRKRHVQLTLDEARRTDGRHGGWRPGAGRPRGRVDVEHGKRDRFPERYPQLITLRIVDGVNIRKDWLRGLMFQAFRDSQREDFRITQFDIEGNHFHLTAEAASAERLASGMNGLQVRLARRINKKLGRRGKLFAGRYHTRSLKTPAEVRNALRYVLLNARHHAAERGEQLRLDWVDRFSTAAWFDGWTRPIRDDEAIRMRREVVPPIAAARTWLLREGWRKHGLISINDVPGPRVVPAHARTRAANT
jgi:hypothetical protein